MAGDDWGWLSSQVVTAATAFSHQLSTIDDTTVRVPNLEWSVAELAAHLVSLPSVYRRLDDVGRGFRHPPDWDAFSRQARAHLTEVDPGTLGEMLELAAKQLVAELGDDPSAPFTLYGIPTTAGNVAAGYLGELIVHGMDLSRLTGIRVTLDRRQASVIARQYMTVAPAFLDEERARAAEGTYHVRLKGGDDFTYRLVDGALTVESGVPERPDARLLADPVAFVLVSLGRMSPLRAAITGKVIGYGRKPWRLGPLGRVRADGV